MSEPLLAPVMPVARNAIGVFVTALLIAAPARAQQQVASPELTRLIDAIGGLSSNELSMVERGEAIAATVARAPADRNEVALVGLVAIDVPRAFYLSRARDLPTFLATPTRSTFGLFHDPATAADMSGFTLDESDAAAVAKCRPTRCQLKLPAAIMDRLREPASNPVLQTNANVRAWLASLVNDYRVHGDESLPVYDDTHAGERSADGFQQLLSEDAPLLRDAAPFTAYLHGAPRGDTTGLSEAFYWAVERPPGLKPILSVAQLSTYSSADTGAPIFVAVKQLYANHYFDAFLDLTALVDRPSPAGGTYALLIRRVRFDDLPRRGLINLRGRIVGKLRDAMRDELARAKQVTEAAYRDRPPGLGEARRQGKTLAASTTSRRRRSDNRPRGLRQRHPAGDGRPFRLIGSTRSTGPWRVFTDVVRGGGRAS